MKKSFLVIQNAPKRSNRRFMVLIVLGALFVCYLMGNSGIPLIPHLRRTSSIDLYSVVPGTISAGPCASGQACSVQDVAMVGAAGPPTSVALAPAEASARPPDAGVVTEASSEKLEAAKKALSLRTCGSPATQGFAKIVYPLAPASSCLARSPTIAWYAENDAATAGTRLDLVPTYEEAALYDGLIVAWGHSNLKASAQECAKQCAEYKRESELMRVGLPCNSFAFCPDTKGCWEPDISNPDVSAKGSCWLKFTEGPANPEIVLRGSLPRSMTQRHPGAPPQTSWTSGVLLPAGVKPSNGTYSPRHSW